MLRSRASMGRMAPTKIVLKEDLVMVICGFDQRKVGIAMNILLQGSEAQMRGKVEGPSEAASVFKAFVTCWMQPVSY